MEDYFTTTEAAKKLRLTPETIRKKCRNGEIQHVKTPSGRTLIPQNEIKRKMEEWK